MDVTTNELPSLVGKVLVVQVEVDLDDEDYREVTGKCIIATEAGLVIQAKGKTVMLQMADVIDVDVRPRRLARRWLDHIEIDMVRQHLLDRHGLPYEVLRSIDTALAVEAHNKIDHRLIGHEHGERPTRGVRARKEA